MKKIYSTPTIEVERFDVIDVITTSATESNAVIKSSTTPGVVNEVQIMTQW